MTSTAMPPAEAPASVLIDVKVVAALCNCSTRHILRLADRAAMPPPVRLGSLVRWRRQEILEWIDHGCPDQRRRAS